MVEARERPVPGGDPALAAAARDARAHRQATQGAPPPQQFPPRPPAAAETPRVASDPAAQLPERTRGGLPLAPTPADVDTNATHLARGVGERQPNRPEDVQRIQGRLHELGLYNGPVDGQFNDATRDALTQFQSSHRTEIGQIASDGRRDGLRDSRYARSTQSTVTPGALVPGDPTHQALCQAWPHMVGGQLRTESEAYDYYASQVRGRGLPFDESQPQVIGIRGYQGGVPHAEQHGGTYDNAYDDTMVLLTREGGQPRVREYRATVDPGSHGHEGVDARTFGMLPDQQTSYRLERIGHDSGHADRPGLQWQAGAGTDTPQGHQAELNARHSGQDDAFNARGRIMIHSGDAQDRVAGSSYGCQVVHGNWYPGFYSAMERAAGEGGAVRYTLLDGQDLTP